MNFLLVFSKVSVISLLILVGFCLKKANIVEKSAQGQLNNLLFYVFLPCTLIKAFQVPFNKTNFSYGIKIALMMFVVYFVLAFISAHISKFLTDDPKQQSLYTVGMVLPNVTYIGYPVIGALLGPEYLFYLVLTKIPFEVVSWTYMAKLIYKSMGIDPPKKTSGLRLNLDALKAPPLIATIIAVILYVLNYTIPDPFMSTINYLAGAMSPVAMIAIGISLASSDLKKLISNKGMYIGSIFKLLIYPLTLLLILKLAGLEGPMLVIPVAMLAMPTAGYTNILANKFNSDVTFSAELISMTTILSLITIPIIMTLL